MLGLVVRQVSCTWAPVYPEHLLGFLTSHPEEAYVPRLDSSALHVFVRYTVRSGVASLDWCLALRMAHLNYGVPG